MDGHSAGRRGRVTVWPVPAVLIAAIVLLLIGLFVFDDRLDSLEGQLGDQRPVVVSSVRYFDADGAAVRSFFDVPLTLDPLATAEFLVEAEDTSGGSGANFSVEWSADPGSSLSLIESVMVGMDGAHGTAFTSHAVEIPSP